MNKRLNGQTKRNKTPLSVLSEFDDSEPSDFVFKSALSQDEIETIRGLEQHADTPSSVRIKQPCNEEIIKGEFSNNSKTEPKTILEQFSNNSKTEPKTILEQFSNNSKTKESSFSNDSKTEPKTEPKTILKRFSNNSKTTTSLGSVTGIQRKILEYFFARAQVLGSLNVGKIYTDVLAESLCCSVETVRTSIQRLEKKSLVIRKEYKTGRGGFSVYEIEKSAHQNLVFENNSRTILEQFSNNSKTEPKTEPKTEASSSSSNIYKYNNTTIQIPEPIRRLISTQQILEILEIGLLSEADLRESLEHFAFDHEKGLVKSKTTPVGMFMGMSRSGKKYFSPKLIEMETEELREHEKLVSKALEENARLKHSKLYEAYLEFKKQNPEFIEEIKRTNVLAAENEIVADKVGLAKFKENQTGL